MPQRFANNASSTLNGAITNVATSLVVTSASSFPTTTPFQVQVESEIMTVTGIAGTTFTVTRAQESTAGASHANAIAITGPLTAKSLVTLYYADVRAFGAKGDGTTNDSTSIASAITSVTSTGGIVYFPEGTYRIGSIIIVPSKVTLRGAGMQATIIQAINTYAPTPTVTNGSHMIQNTTVAGGDTDIVIEDMTLDGNETTVTTYSGTATEANSHLLDIRGVTRLTIRGVRVINAIKWSIHLLRCTDVEVSGCRVLTGQAGVSPVRVEQDGIHTTECQRFRIVSNDVVTNGTTALVGDDTIVVRSATTGSNPCKDGVIANNVLSSGTRAVCLVMDSDQDIENIAITGNTIYQTENTAIMADWISGTGKFKNLSIVGNTIRDLVGTTGHAIFVESGGTNEQYDGVVIAGNLIESATNTSSIGVGTQKGRRLVITGNVFRDFKGSRTIIVGDTAMPVEDFVVSNNVIDMSTTIQASSNIIMLSRSRYGVVSGNVIIGSTTYIGAGIYITGDATNPATDIIVVGNKIRNCIRGVQEAGTGTDYNLIHANSLRGNTTPAPTTVGANTVAADNIL